MFFCLFKKSTQWDQNLFNSKIIIITYYTVAKLVGFFQLCALNLMNPPIIYTSCNWIIIIMNHFKNIVGWVVSDSCYDCDKRSNLCQAVFCFTLLISFVVWIIMQIEANIWEAEDCFPLITLEITSSII